MKELKCKLCGGETYDKEGICSPCRLFKKDNTPLNLSGDGGVKKTGGVKMRRKNKKCSDCGTEATSNRSAQCHNCGQPYPRGYKKDSGQAGMTQKKRRGRTTNYEVKQRGIIPVPTCRGKRESRKKNKDNYDDILLKLISAKSGYQQKLNAIDNAIEVLKEYAA